jgi:nitric oxide reductase activation protein
MAEPKVSLGQAIDQIIGALEGLDQNARLTAISAACKHLKIEQPMSDEDDDASGDVQDKGDQSGSNTTRSRTIKQSGKQVDIRALKTEKSPDSAKQMACLVAYYLQELAPKDERKQTVSTQDIEKYFKQANFKLPKKLEQVLVDAKRSGYFESAARGEYKLNAVGYNLVVHGLPAKKGS